MSGKIKPAHILSAIIAILMFLASIGGLAIENLYQDNFLVTSGWYGNDLVTLFVATPILVTALILTIRCSQRARLVWLGILAYTLYNYGFYLFGAAFNSFFLLYAALFTLSIFALIFALVSLDVKKIAQQFSPNLPVKWVSGYIFFVALFLGVFWIFLSLNYVFTGQIPPVVIAVDGKTNLIAALDLSMVVSFGLLGAIWLWQRQPWGYVLATIWNIKGAVYMLALSATTVSAVQAGASEDLSTLALWGFIGIGCLISSMYLLSHCQN